MIMTKNRSPIMSFMLANYKLALIILSVGILIFLIFGSETVLGLKPAPLKLVVYAYSAQEEALMDGILPAFEKAYEDETGIDVEMDAVFGPSGTLATQIYEGADVHVAIFSSEAQIEFLKPGGLVYRETQPSIIGYSPMVIITRAGNPHSILDYKDLGKPELQLLHADPRTSGAGEWSLLAEYGSALLGTDNPSAAKEQLTSIWRNVRLFGSSMRAALSLFELGAGDALVIYEQDALFAQGRQYPLEIVQPPNMLISQPAAVIIDGNVTKHERDVAQAFIDFMLGMEGQQIFSSYYLRPVEELNSRSLEEDRFFTVEELGGWSAAYEDGVEQIWLDEIEPHLNLAPSPILVKPESSE